MAIIIETFNNTGVNAGTAKRPHVFNMPLARADNEIKKIYGNVILNKEMASSGSASTLVKNPGANIIIIIGAKITPSTLMINNIIPKLVET